MRRLKYLLDGFSRRLQDFYLQYPRVDLQVVKQTNSLWIFFFTFFLGGVFYPVCAQKPH